MKEYAMNYLRWILLCFPAFTMVANAQTEFDFENSIESGAQTFVGRPVQFVQGIEGQALSLSGRDGYAHLDLPGLGLDGSKDFTVQFWMKTNSDKPTVLLSQKDFKNKGIAAQKNPGWALYSSSGTLGWCIGSKKRRINYERDNGDKMPLSDGNWHQLTLTYSKTLTEMRLYYDGRHVAVYKVGFDFSNSEPLRIGTPGNGFDYEKGFLPGIVEGKIKLQAFVDAFNQMGAGSVQPEEFISLIVGPERLFEEKMKHKGHAVAKPESAKLKAVTATRRELYSSPYTVYQNRNLTLVKPVSRIYALRDNQVILNTEAARAFTKSEQLYPADFAMDQLVIHEGVLNTETVLKNYQEHREANLQEPADNLQSLTVGVWNIWHGGIHWTTEKDGWDSRLRIVEMAKEHNVDVILMQETYSSGDFIAAELGWYFATTSDWDYCFQGANISVLSRYPIKEVFVTKETEFNNVAVKLAISKTQEIYAMSNWYGMQNYPLVADYHKSRFNNADAVPILFGGDFNAIPHTDGGRSPASQDMLEAGFADAYRSLYPDVETNPGYTHRSGSRIDQLYYKGKGLRNLSTKVVSSWPAGFPSDHFLVVAEFELNY